MRSKASKRKNLHCTVLERFRCARFLQGFEFSFAFLRVIKILRKAREIAKPCKNLAHPRNKIFALIFSHCSRIYFESKWEKSRQDF